MPINGVKYILMRAIIKIKTNVVCVQWWCIGGWIGVIDSLRVGRDNRHGFVRAVKRVLVRAICQ